MSGFSAEWLALREPFDATARATSLVAALRPHLPRGTTTQPLAIVDLGCGTGANLRWLAPRLGGVQHWRLLDHDDDLLEAALATTSAWAAARGADVRRSGSELTILATDLACSVRCERRDLSADLSASASTKIELPRGGLVTAAALLDLVSSDWLDALASHCGAAEASVCFALSYDGRTVCTPAEQEDAEVLASFNRHQLGDKGFGPALGPHAALLAQRHFGAAGYRIATQPSDWQIGAQDQAMQRALLSGWLSAALELEPDRRAALTDWLRRRSEHVTADRSLLHVGHVDLVGWR